jgi:hypothetical protein
MLNEIMGSTVSYINFGKAYPQVPFQPEMLQQLNIDNASTDFDFHLVPK